MRITDDPPTTDTAAHLAGLLRSAAGWLQLAATELDVGNVERVVVFARLGQLGVVEAPERIAALAGASA